MTKISELTVISNPDGSFRIPVYNPNGEALSDQNAAILLSALVGGGASLNFAPYDPATTYSKEFPDYVSFNGNTYEYINATPSAGKTPNINPTYWRLASTGNLTHQQNTDLGTRNGSFTIQYQSQDQGPDGQTLLIFGGLQGGRKGAIRFLWDAMGAGSYAFQYTLNYTGGADTWLGLGGGAQIAYKTGNVIDFVAYETHFGTAAAPVTGNITANHTGAGFRHMASMIHNAGVEPTYGAEFVRLPGSQDYTLGANNYYIFDYISSTRINYAIQ